MTIRGSIIERFGFLDDPAGRAARGRRIVALLRDCAGVELAGARVLDIGCSAGLLTAEVAKRARFTVGLEIDAEAVVHAARHAEAPGRLAFVRASAERLPFAAGAFDVVLCNHVYEHVDDVHTLLGEIDRVLAADGACWFAAGHTLQVMEPHYRLPFLSMLPRPLASAWVRGTGRGDRYEIRYLPPWRVGGLLCALGEPRLVSGVALRDPVRYELAGGALRHGALRALVRPFAGVLAWLAPTQLWVVRKKARPAQKTGAGRR